MYHYLPLPPCLLYLLLPTCLAYQHAKHRTYRNSIRRHWHRPETRRQIWMLCRQQAQTTTHYRHANDRGMHLETYPIVLSALSAQLVL
jgi:hypothetical protein